MTQSEQLGRGDVRTPLEIVQQASKKRDFWFLTKASGNSIQDYGHSENIHLESRSHVLTLRHQSETLGGNPVGKLNEDALLSIPIGQGRYLFAVLDGASSQKDIAGLAQHGVSGAFYASHITSYGFIESPEYKALQRRPTLTAGEVMRAVNSWLHAQYANVYGIDYNDVLSIPGMASTFAVVDAAMQEVTIAHVADTVALAIYTDGRIEELTVNQNERFDSETMRVAMNVAGEYGCTLAQLRKTPEAHKKVHDHLKGSFCSKINTPGGCGILNGMPELVTNNLIYEKRIPITDDLHTILIFSDGALLPYLNRGLSLQQSYSLLVENAVVRNLVGTNFTETGAARLKSDPEFEEIPRLKDRDDASIIKLTFK